MGETLSPKMLHLTYPYTESYPFIAPEERADGLR